MPSKTKQKKRDLKWDRYYEKICRSPTYTPVPSPSFFGPQRVVRKLYISKNTIIEGVRYIQSE